MTRALAGCNARWLARVLARYSRRCSTRRCISFPRACWGNCLLRTAYCRVSAFASINILLLDLATPALALDVLYAFCLHDKLGPGVSDICAATHTAPATRLAVVSRDWNLLTIYSDEIDPQLTTSCRWLREQQHHLLHQSEVPLQRHLDNFMIARFRVFSNHCEDRCCRLLCWCQHNLKASGRTKLPA